jgi:hypothetical protein
VARAWQAAPSLLGLPGFLASAGSAAGMPIQGLKAFQQAWPYVAVAGLCLYGFLGFWRPVALFPGLALGAWVWILLAPQLQGPLFLAPLALLLLVPGRLAWRLAAGTFVLLVLHDHLPGLRDLQLQQDDPAGLWRGTHWGWAVLICAWLLWVLLECIRLDTHARRSQRSAF